MDEIEIKHEFGLSKKQAGFVKDYVETGNGTEAVIRNYDVKSRENASKMAGKLLDSVNVTEAINKTERTLASQIPDELLIEKHKALLNKIDEQGEIDVAAVSKGLDMGYKVKGAYAPEKHQNVNVNINTADPRAIELAKEYEQKLKDLL